MKKLSMQWLSRHVTVCVVLLLSNIPIKADEVVVVVSRESSVFSLSREQLTRIFLGTTVFLPNGKQYEPVDLVEGSPKRDQFYEDYIDKSGTQLKAHWSRLIFTGRGLPPKQLKDPASLISYLQANPDAIGYIDQSHVNDHLTVVDIE